MLKIYLKDIGYMLGTIIIGIFLFTLLNYFNILSDKIMSFIKILLPIGVFGFGGFYLSKNSSKRGIIEGLKIGLILIAFMFLVSILGLSSGFEWKSILYYLILLFASIIGGIIAKQGKENTKK